LWSFARWNLGLSEDEFLDLTMAQYNALGKRYAEREEWLDYRTGLICSVLANINRDPKKQKAFKPQDFMPQRKESKKQDPQDFLTQMRMWNAALGGTETINE